MSLVSSPHAVLLEQVISAASMRHKVIANNIANVNTPGFKRSEVRFEEILRDAISSGQKKLPMTITHKQHLAPVRQTKPLTPHTINETSMRTDGNNVDVELEMANMAKNTIYYDAAIQQLSRHFSSIKSVINEGRR